MADSNIQVGVPLLELDEITIEYYSKQSLVRPLLGFSLQMHPGEFIVILGNSGAGKSTLLHVVAGFHRPKGIGLAAPQSGGLRMTGKVKINGLDVSMLEPRLRPVGLVMQQFNLYPDMKVAENLEFPLKMARRTPKSKWKEQVRDVAERLQLTRLLDKYPRQLSGGEAQRVAIGKMLLRDPQIALFDEAFSNLDPVLRKKLRIEVLGTFLNGNSNGSRKGVVFVSHNVEDARNATKIIVMSKSDTSPATSCTVFEGNQSRSAFEELKTSSNVDICELITEVKQLNT